MNHDHDDGDRRHHSSIYTLLCNMLDRDNHQQGDLTTDIPEIPVDSLHARPDSASSNDDDDDDDDLPRWYPHCRNGPIYHGNKEALGWALDAVGRSVTFIAAGAFLSTALLTLAKQAAGCATEPEPGSNVVPPCNERVYGIRPSSLLTTYTVVVGIISASLMPFMGAIVDYTKHRRLVGRTTSVLFTCLLLPQIFVGEQTWLAVAILQVCVAFIGWAQTMVTYAYLPELTNSVEILNSYTQSFTIYSFGSMVLFIVVVIGVSTATGNSDDAVATARMAMAIAFAVSCVFLYLSWGILLQTRPPARQLPEGHSLWTSGFVQVYHTSIRIYKEYAALKWFYVSVAFIDAAINSLATIAITYLTDTLAFTSQENGIAILVMLLGSIPGAFAASWSTTRLNPIRSSILATTLLTANTITVAAVLKQPGQETATYILGFVWGIGTGWKWTVDRLVASSIIPSGQDAELMGIYLFSGQILTWCPPLVFTALNEAGVSQRVGIGSLAIFFALGAIALFLIGSYDNAMEVAGRRQVVVDELPDTASSYFNNDGTMVATKFDVEKTEETTAEKEDEEDATLILE